MAGLFKENQLNSYALNREAPQYHLVSRYINMTETEYCQLDAARAQEARLAKAIEACSTKECELPYFFCAILKNMLKWDADERLSSIKLKTIFEDPDQRLMDNLDNVAYVDSLIETARKQDDKEMLEKFDKDLRGGGQNEEESEEDFDSEDDIQWTQAVGSGNAKADAEEKDFV